MEPAGIPSSLIDDFQPPISGELVAQLEGFLVAQPESTLLLNEIQELKTKLPPRWIVMCLMVFTLVFHAAFYGYQVVWSTQLFLLGGVLKNQNSLFTNAFDGILYSAALLGGIIADAYIGHYAVAVLGCVITFIALLSSFLTYFFVGVGTPELVLPVSVVSLFFFSCGVGLVKSVIGPVIGSCFGDQQHKERSRAFAMYFWMIQMGAIPASAGAPIILMNLRPNGYYILFAILSGLAFVSFLLLVMVCAHVRAPPFHFSAFADFVRVAIASCRCCKPQARPRQPWIDRAASTGRFSSSSISRASESWQVMKLIAVPTIPFYTCVFLIFGVWVDQANSMNRCLGQGDNLMCNGFLLPAAESTVLNFIFDVLLTPILTYGVYPLLQKLGFRCTDLQKIAAGVLVTASAVLVSAVVNLFLSRGAVMSIYWIVPQYALLSLAESILIATVYEFAYTQAPASMKAAMTGTLLFFIACANFLLVGIIAIPADDPTIMLFVLSGVMVLVFVLYIPLSMQYKYRQSANVNEDDEDRPLLVHD